MFIVTPLVIKRYKNLYPMFEYNKVFQFIVMYFKKATAPHSSFKRYFNRSTNSASFLCITVNVLQTPLPFYATQIINPFLCSRIIANHDKGEGFQPIMKSLNSQLFLQYIISFISLIKHYLHINLKSLIPLFKTYYPNTK